MSKRQLAITTIQLSTHEADTKVSKQPSEKTQSVSNADNLVRTKRITYPAPYMPSSSVASKVRV